MPFDPQAARDEARAHLLHLVRQGGPYWHEYAARRAQDLEREDPTLHAGLHDAVKAAADETNPPRAPRVLRKEF
jgi:hypothetical protein